MSILRNIKADIYERFCNFQAIYSWAIMIPWGMGFVYFSLYEERYLYKYAGITIGVHLIIRGLREGTFNPIKYWNKIEEMQQRRKNRES